MKEPRIVCLVGVLPHLIMVIKSDFSKKVNAVHALHINLSQIEAARDAAVAAAAAAAIV